MQLFTKNQRNRRWSTNFFCQPKIVIFSLFLETSYPITRQRCIIRPNALVHRIGHKKYPIGCRIEQTRIVSRFSKKLAYVISTSKKTTVCFAYIRCSGVESDTTIGFLVPNNLGIHSHNAKIEILCTIFCQCRFCLY